MLLLEEVIPILADNDGGFDQVFGWQVTEDAENDFFRDEMATPIVSILCQKNSRSQRKLEQDLPHTLNTKNSKNITCISC